MAKASERIQELRERTAGPRVKAVVTVNQPYAQDQHETLHYRHASGGQAKYLEQPLLSGHKPWIQDFANDLLNSPKSAAEEWGGVGRELKGEVSKKAPIDFGDLRNSAGLVVKEGSSVVIVEPPKQPRLSEAELDAKDYMRSMGVGYRE